MQHTLIFVQVEHRDTFCLFLFVLSYHLHRGFHLVALLFSCRILLPNFTAEFCRFFPSDFSRRILLPIFPADFPFWDEKTSTFSTLILACLTQPAACRTLSAQ
jgi:hypothetical protein